MVDYEWFIEDALKFDDMLKKYTDLMSHLPDLMQLLKSFNEGTNGKKCRVDSDGTDPLAEMETSFKLMRAKRLYSSAGSSYEIHKWDRIQVLLAT